MQRRKFCISVLKSYRTPLKEFKFPIILFGGNIILIQVGIRKKQSCIITSLMLFFSPKSTYQLNFTVPLTLYFENFLWVRAKTAVNDYGSNSKTTMFPHNICAVCLPIHMHNFCQCAKLSYLHMYLHNVVWFVALRSAIDRIWERKEKMFGVNQ